MLVLAGGTIERGANVLDGQFEGLTTFAAEFDNRAEVGLQGAML